MLYATFALVSALVSAPASAAPGSALLTDLQAIVNGAAKRYNCSISLGARMGSTPLAVASGFVSLDGVTKAKTSDRYAWGSVTKTITGSAIMKLVAEGKLQLDDKVYKYVDPVLKAANYPYPTMEYLFQTDRWGIPPAVEYNATDVTIRHLLSMTSGVPDYDTDAYRHLQYTHAKAGFSPLDILDYVHGPLMFEPGKAPSRHGSHHHGGGFNYCSVNFILLGFVLTHFSGAKSWDAYDQRAILPAELRPRVSFAGLNDLCSITAPVHGLDRQSFAAYPTFDVSSINCLGGWTAGNVIMDAPAAAEWAMALYGPAAAVIPASALAQMLPNATQGYGLATFNFDGRYANGTAGRAFGHLGDTYGFTSTISYFPEPNVAIAVATNLEEGQSGPSEVNCLAYNRILDAMRGRAVPRTCKYVSHSYYGGGCQCSA